MAVVSLVGAEITAGPGIAERVESALAGMNVRMTAQGSSRLSISLAVPEPAMANCVERLHREFFKAPDADLFEAAPESSRSLSIVHATSRTLASLPLGEPSIC